MNKARREKDLNQVLFCLYKMEKLDMLNTECQGEGEAYENIKRFRYYWAKNDGPQQLSYGWGCAAGEDCGPYRRAAVLRCAVPRRLGGAFRGPAGRNVLCD